MPTLSVVIPSYRSKHLADVVSSLKGLEQLQLIIVDSSPEKPALDAPGCTLVHLSKRVSAGTARNEGARRARADYLLFVDSDVLFTEKDAELCWRMASI